VRCSAVQCSAVRCSAVRCSAVEYSGGSAVHAVMWCAVQCNGVVLGSAAVLWSGACSDVLLCSVVLWSSAVE
jgi:hypothetical protein